MEISDIMRGGWLAGRSLRYVYLELPIPNGMIEGFNVMGKGVS